MPETFPEYSKLLFPLIANSSRIAILGFQLYHFIPEFLTKFQVLGICKGIGKNRFLLGIGPESEGVFGEDFTKSSDIPGLNH
jgi:hypothetical protein